MTVVGVVADMRTLGLETGPDPEVFAPIAQAGWDMQNSFFVVARTAGEPLGQARGVEAAIRNLDGGLPVVGMQSMEARLNNSFSARRFSLFLLGLFAALALFLAVIGLAGVIAYTVSQRTREMAIRAALGAGASDLVRLVVRQGLALAGIGVLVGMAASASLSSLIASELFEVKPIDPILYAATAALLLILAALACWVPGRRAARTDPAVTLRCD